MTVRDIELSSPVFTLTDPLKDQRRELVNNLHQNVRMYAYDNTRDVEDPQLRERMVDVAVRAVGDVMHVLDDYYIMPHNEQSRELPNLSGGLAEVWDTYYMEVNS